MSGRSRFVESSGLLLAWGGVVLMVLFLTGWFQHPERMDLLRDLDQERLPEATSESAAELLAHFGAEPAGEANGERAHLILVQRRGEPFVALRGADGRRTLVASREEAGWWALEDDASWGWSGVGLAAIGLGLLTAGRLGGLASSGSAGLLEVSQ